MVTDPLQDPAVANTESSTSREQTNLELQLLFVDDEEEDLYLFEQGLEELKLKHKIYHARSGDEMFQMLDTVKPDYIFLDIFLPGKSGIACLKMLRIKEKYQNVPIIIYSKFHQPSFIEDCYQAKANYFVVKSESVDKVSKAVKTVFSTNWERDQFPPRDHFLIHPKN